MSRRPQPGFTLVELLVVIVIIALLAALITPAVMAAMRAAKRTAITTEINSLASAVEAYRAKYNAYPPDTDAGLKAHLKNIFINADPSYIDSTVPSFSDNGAQILVYCLRGYTQNKRKPLPVLPINGSQDANGNTVDNFFTFKSDRLTTGNTPIYLAPSALNSAYVYFDCSRYQKNNSSATYTPPSGNGTGSTQPYITGKDTSSGRRLYCNPASFQIISAGLDGDFGANSAEKTFPKGDNYGPGDQDNLTNFSTGTLDDSKP